MMLFTDEQKIDPAFIKFNKIARNVEAILLFTSISYFKVYDEIKK